MGISKTNCVWIAKGVKGTSGCIMTQWRANANMPSFNLCGGNCFDTGMVCTFYDANCANYDASTLCRGFEIFQGAAMYRYCVCGTDCLNGRFCRCLRWLHCDGGVIGSTFTGINCIDLPAPGVGYYSWQYYFYFVQQGVNCWEIDVDGCYRLQNCVTCVSGDDLSIGTVTRATCITNVPSAASTGIDRGTIWVEGNNLNFIPEQDTEIWEHSISGDYQGSGATPGAIWIDTNHYLNWANSGGCYYRAPWRICQFCSWFNGSSGPNPSPGAGYAGAIWADGEFGYSHLAYIGCDGNKYITGAGNCPHIAP